MRKELTNGEWILFQDDFYNLLQKYGVEKIDIEHKHFSQICKIRNEVAEFIEEERYLNEHKELSR